MTALVAIVSHMDRVTPFTWLTTLVLAVLGEYTLAGGIVALDCCVGADRRRRKS